MEEYKKKYEEIIKSLKEARESMGGYTFSSVVDKIIPELKESKDEKIREHLLKHFSNKTKEEWNGMSIKDIIIWLEKQGEQKEINLVEILKHYPRETELYSPLYGKLWLAEVDEEHEIITCYKHQLESGCIRAVLEQEDTVSFYSNGTTGLPDFTVSKDCMLFLYNTKKQGEQKSEEKTKFYDSMDDLIADALIEEIENSELNDKSKHNRIFWIKSHRQNPAWSEEDEGMCIFTIKILNDIHYKDNANWLKSLKERYTWKPSDEQMDALSNALGLAKSCGEESSYDLRTLYEQLKKLREE